MAEKKSPAFDLAPCSKDDFERALDWQFFKAFGDEGIQSLSNIAFTRKVREGERIIVQGRDDAHIYFLLSGKVAIYVHGQKVSLLQRKGDLIGEMNIISSKPASSTVVAEVDTELLAFHCQDIHALPSVSEEAFMENVFKAYAIALTEKLHYSQDEGKKFELINQQLEQTQKTLEQVNADLKRKVNKRTQELSQKNDALLIAMAKMKELDEARKSSLANFSALANDAIVPLMELFRDLKEQDRGISAEEIDHGLKLLHEGAQRLASASSVTDLEKSLPLKKIFCLGLGPREQLMIKMAIGGSGANVIFADTLGPGREQELAQADIVVAAVAQIAAIQERLAKTGAKKLVGISADRSSSLDTMRRYSDCGLAAVLSHEEGHHPLAVRQWGACLLKLASGDHFGIGKYLNWGTSLQFRKIDCSEKRRTLLSVLDEYLEGLGLRTSLRQRAGSAAEEILMNVLYDAPTIEGEAKFNHLDRQQQVQLDQDDHGLLSYACDGSFLALCAEDPHGALERDIILRYLDGQGHREEESPKKGGAGLGLRSLYELADYLIFNVQKGERTEVICLFQVFGTRQHSHAEVQFFIS